MPIKLKKAALQAANENPAALDQPLQEAVKAFQPVVEMRPIGELQPNSRKLKVHPDKQVQLLAASITEFGFVVPIVIDRRHDPGRPWPIYGG
jgi:hypothetical protein